MTFEMICVTMTLILVFTTSVYAAYAFDTRTTTTRSITNIKSYEETNHYHTTRVALQGDSGINRIKDNIEVINRTEITKTPILPEFIASSINGNLTAGDNNRVRPNPEFILIDNQSGIIAYALPSFLEDSSKSCVRNFICRANLTTGWQDNTSLQVSTKPPHNINGTWSSIYGNEIDVTPNGKYELLTHMKLNDVATNSHIGIKGFNETSKMWLKNQIKQCPAGVNGSLEWHQFSCEVTIPDNTTKIRPVLNAGWSSVENEQAVTFFDDIYMIRLTDVNFVPNVPTIINDPNLKIEVVNAGLESPTSMAFLGPDDILVLEKNNGTVQRIINGTMLPEPLLDLNVGNKGERGLLGIAIAAMNENVDRNGTSSNTTNTTRVFLYLTESKDDDNDRREPLSNHLYRYDLKNNKLVNPKLLLELPLTPKTIHC